MIVKTTIVQNRLGLHARAASKLVQVAQEFGAEVSIHNGEHAANGKSIMSIMMLQASIGTELEVHASGEDAEAAIAAIVALIEDKFGEPE